jgi:hypothetical protein
MEIFGTARAPKRSESSQLVVTLGAEILRGHALVNGENAKYHDEGRFRSFREAGLCQRLEI